MIKGMNFPLQYCKQVDQMQKLNFFMRPKSDMAQKILECRIFQLEKFFSVS